jgi:glycosyltransferase involved in cell wall biosynthesis
MSGLITDSAIPLSVTPSGAERCPVGLNVLYLSVTPDILGDADHFRRTYLKGLGTRVARIDYLVCTPPGLSPSPQMLGPNVTLYPVLSRNRWHFISRAFDMARRLHAAHPFDLVVCMTPIAPAAVAYRFRRLTNVPFIVHWSHDFLGGWGWRLETPSHLLYWPWLTWIVRQADGIRPIAEPLARSIVNAGASPSRVRLLPTLLQQDLFVPASHQLSKPSPYAGRPSDRHLLFVGRLARQKNLPLLLRATADLIAQGRSLHLWIIGDGELRRSLERKAAALGICAHVTFLGRVASSELQPYYAHSDVFVLPSNHEGLARVLAEASLCAAPIVCTNVGGIVDHVQDETTALLVPRGNATALASAIGSLLDDRGLAGQLGQAARRLAEQRYPLLERQYDNWVNYWSTIAAQPRPPSHGIDTSPPVRSPTSGTGPF